MGSRDQRASWPPTTGCSALPLQDLLSPGASFHCSCLHCQDLGLGSGAQRPLRDTWGFSLPCVCVCVCARAHAHVRARVCTHMCVPGTQIKRSVCMVPTVAWLISCTFCYLIGVHWHNTSSRILLRISWCASRALNQTFESRALFKFTDHMCACETTPESSSSQSGVILLLRVGYLGF